MTYADEVLADSPVAYWRLGESSGSTAVDETTNGHDGTYNGPTLGQTGALTGDSDTSVALDGTDDYVDMGSPSALNITGDLTLEMWVKAVVDSAGGIVSWANDGFSTYPFHTQVSSGDGTVQLNRNGTEVFSNTAADDDVWHHIVITDDRTNDEVTFYFDGAVDKQTSYTPSLSSGDGSLTLARISDGGYEGLLDEVAIYGSVLSAGRIQYHYYFGITGSKYATEVLMDDPTAYWRLGEASGSTAVDETANNHDGTYNGPTLGASGALSNDNDTAANFDGTDDWVDIPQAARPSGSALTLEAWFVSSGISSQSSIIYLSDDPWTHMSLKSDGTFRGTVNTDSGVVDVDSTAAFDDGVFHHGVVTYDGSDVRIYIDGTELNSASLTGSLTYSGANGPSIGSGEDGNDNFFNGTIDEPAVYASALSPTRIQAHYDAATSTTGTPTTITIDSHTLVLNHMPLLEGVLSPHVILVSHFKPVPLQPHILHLLHQAVALEPDESETGQAKALAKALGYGWGVPDPSGSANEKIETPRETWPIDRMHEAERIMRQEGVEEETARAMGGVMRRLGEDIQLDVRANLEKYEWHANVHTHPGIAGAEGTPVGPAEALFTVNGPLSYRLATDGSVFWSRGDNYGDLAVDPVERRVFVIGRADDPNGTGTLNQTIDRVVSYDFDGNEQWNTDLHSRLGDAAQTVWAFTLARDRSALYTIYYDGSQLGVVRIGASDGSVSVIGKDTSGGGDLSPSAAFDTDGDYLYFSDGEFVNNDRGRIAKFSLGDGSLIWEMSPDLANSSSPPMCVTDTLLWAQKENGTILLIDKSNGGILSSIVPSGTDGANGGTLWKDFHNTNSIYALSTNYSVPDTWLYRVYVVGGVLQAEELEFFEDFAMERVIRDAEGNFFIGGGQGSAPLIKLGPDLTQLWRIDGPDPTSFCTEQGRSVHWG